MPLLIGLACIAPDNSFDVCLREIIALKQQREPTRLCEGIGKAVAIIEPSRMSTFAKSPPCEPSDLGLVLVHRDNLDGGAVEQQIKLAPARLSLSAFDYDRRFQKIRRRQETQGAGLDRLGNTDGVRFVQQHGDDRRGIDDH